MNLWHKWAYSIPASELGLQTPLAFNRLSLTEERMISGDELIYTLQMVSFSLASEGWCGIKKSSTPLAKIRQFLFLEGAVWPDLVSVCLWKVGVVAVRRDALCSSCSLKRPTDLLTCTDLIYHYSSCSLRLSSGYTEVPKSPILDFATVWIYFSAIWS